MREGVERFTEFSNILFIKLISEIEDEREKEGLLRRFDKRYCWDSFEGKTGDEMLDHINNTILKEFADHYKGSGDIFQKELKIKKSVFLSFLTPIAIGVGNDKKKLRC